MASPRRRFSQNFLHDAAVIQRMLMTLAAGTDETFLEIGPGRGALTEPLLKAGAALKVIEIDRDLAAALSARHGHNSQLEVIVGDALRYPLAQARPESGRLRVIGNLPYNLSTPLLFHLTDHLDGIEDLHLLLQREVVTRMAANPGSRDYGRLSVMLQYRCQVEALFDVPPGAFYPAPQVTSSFVRLRPHPTPPTEPIDEQCLSLVVARAFSQRRKTLRNALRGLLERADIQAADIDPAIRPEQIDLAGYARLARQLASIQAEPYG